MILVRAREGTLDVPKQLAFHKFAWHGSAVDTQHGVVRSHAGSMDRSGDELFAGTALAPNENAARSLCDSNNALFEFNHRLTLTKQFVEVCIFVLKPFVFVTQ